MSGQNRNLKYATGYKAYALGVDIGTTTFSFVVLGKGGKTESLTVKNDTVCATENRYFTEQDAEKAAETVLKTVNGLFDRFPGIDSVGISCQMHGIVYVNGSGDAVSNLITWQDRRGDIPSAEGITVCAEISRITGIAEKDVHSGYGLVSHYYNMKHGLVPEDAVCVCTIGDYIAMRLTGKTVPVMHASNAHSFGFFDVRSFGFDKNLLTKLGIPVKFLPEVEKECVSFGQFRGIPVKVAVGDNQAAFYGSVQDPGHSVLVNIGTGSQVSVMSDSFECPENAEVRPYFGGRYLLSASALCGGRAYALLEKFYREYMKEATGKDEPQYEIMNRLAEKALESGCVLDVSTLFCGTRSDPSLRGSVNGISEDNLRPEALTTGVLYGMIKELYGYFRGFGVNGIISTVASGNAVRKNSALRRITDEIFPGELIVSEHTEEAAYGAALLGRGGSL